MEAYVATQELEKAKEEKLKSIPKISPTRQSTLLLTPYSMRMIGGPTLVKKTRRKKRIKNREKN